MNSTYPGRTAAFYRESDEDIAMELCGEAREASEPGLRQLLFQKAVGAASRSGDAVLELRILALMIVYQIGSGHAQELIVRFWPLFRGLSSRVAQIPGDEQHLALWSAERVLYFAVEFPEIPFCALESAMMEWREALCAVGGYSPAAPLRLQLHQALRMGRDDLTATLFSALERSEPESDLRPRAGKLPGEEEDPGYVRATDFGCGAYANQIRVLYHCARDDARAAWRAARYFVDGRSACDLGLCAVAPREAFAAILEPLHGAGMNAEADRCHLLGLPQVCGQATTSGLTGHHLRHLVRRGAVDCARYLLGSTLALPGNRATAFQRFHFLRGAVAVLKKSLLSLDRDRCAGFLSEATVLAEKFDDRNGNNRFHHELSAVPRDHHQ